MKMSQVKRERERMVCVKMPARMIVYSGRVINVY